MEDYRIIEQRVRKLFSPKTGKLYTWNEQFPISGKEGYGEEIITWGETSTGDYVEKYMIVPEARFTIGKFQKFIEAHEKDMERS